MKRSWWCRITINLFWLFVFQNSGAQAFSQCMPFDTARLNTAYRELVKNRNSLEKQLLFLEAFPSSFDEFYVTFRFCPAEGYDLSMYHKAPDHILNGLAMLHLVPDSFYLDKLIWLSLGGQFFPDAPSYLKQVLRQNMKEKQSTFFLRLNKFSEKQLVAFWYFYFHSRFEKDYIKEYESFGKLADAYPKVIEAMKIAYPASCGKVWY